MNKKIILCAIFAGFLAGCNAVKNDSLKQDSKVLNQADKMKEEANKEESLEDAMKRAEAEFEKSDIYKQKKSDEELIMSVYGDVLSSVDVGSWSKGISIDLKGKSRIMNFHKLGKSVADLVRKNRGITGKIDVYYTYDGKELSAKF